MFLYVPFLNGVRGPRTAEPCRKRFWQIPCLSSLSQFESWAVAVNENFAVDSSISQDFPSFPN